ncbi:AAA family ATPase [Paenibacillus chungangensis]|uniref:AAA family ATPase n=1 Tax=Paenibacillus chungangensis TaxID=696535 RepID=A0ABW3HPW6_9BACL
MLESREQVHEASVRMTRLKEEISRVIVGQVEVIEQLLWCLFAGGHALLEGVPGLGKTMLVRTVADAVSLQFSRIQFTPDLMPSDITGTTVIDFGSGGRQERMFQQGPVFANIVLADEINRATPKTQSALLEAMGEGSVTAGGSTHQLQKPFFVLATQNPIEQEGTYPLPEAQLDRFLIKIGIQYPTREELKEIVRRTTATAIPRAEEVMDGHDVAAIQAIARGILIGEEVLDLAARLVMMTHPAQSDTPETVKRYVQYGAGPRAVQALVALGKVRALQAGRLQVSWQDIKEVAKPVLRHRVILTYEAEATGHSADEITDAIVASLEASR